MSGNDMPLIRPKIGDDRPYRMGRDAERDRQRVQLRLRGPLPTPDAAQVNELDTPLFGAAASPVLL